MTQQIQAQSSLISNSFTQIYELPPGVEGHCSVLIRGVHDQRVVLIGDLLLTIHALVDVPSHLVHCVALLLHDLLDHVFIDHVVSVSHRSRPFVGHHIHHLEVLRLFEPLLEVVAHIPVHTLEHYLPHFESMSALLQRQSSQ